MDKMLDALLSDDETSVDVSLDAGQADEQVGELLAESAGAEPSDAELDAALESSLEQSAGLDAGAAAVAAESVAGPVIGGLVDEPQAELVADAGPKKRGRKKKERELTAEPEFQPVPLDLEPIDPMAFVSKVKADTTPCELRSTTFGIKKTLARHQIDQVADQFHAVSKNIGASKKLIDVSHPLVRKVVRLVRDARRLWKAETLPFPMDGIRLLNKDKIPKFDADMEAYKASIAEALIELNHNYAEVKQQAKNTLGDLYNESDYPEQLFYTIEVGYPTVAAPEYLKQLNPLIYEREQQRMTDMVAAGVRQHEQMLADHLNSLVIGMMEKLTQVDDDGKPKQVRADVLKNFGRFFENLQKSGGINDPVLIEAVNQAQQALAGNTIEKLRSDDGLRSTIAGNLQAVQEMLEASLVTRPNRAIDLSEDDDEDEADEAAEAEAEAVAG